MIEETQIDKAFRHLESFMPTLRRLRKKSECLHTKANYKVKLKRVACCLPSNTWAIHAE